MWRVGTAVALYPHLQVSAFGGGGQGNLDGAANHPSQHFAWSMPQEYVANKPKYYVGMDSMALYSGSFRPLQKASASKDVS
jgi:hypothetical protein